MRCFGCVHVWSSSFPSPSLLEKHVQPSTICAQSIHTSMYTSTQTCIRTTYTHSHAHANSQAYTSVHAYIYICTHIQESEEDHRSTGGVEEHIRIQPFAFISHNENTVCADVSLLHL
mmetsp:Transcript_11655/g.31334  ORF Transcript_11655/g.31334 Transcript_11655/m.31334 type:complete len:117 (+) Transcript_11655:786-1136(+)